ncbi:MAG: chemotaxis protein CheW, partial [Pseudomonadota bacterium]
DFMRGVINLRGSVLPIVDLATRMGLRPPDPTERHVIIVSQVGSRVIGLLVDAVSDILTVLNEQMQPTPEMAQGTTRGFVEKVVAIDGRMIRLVDLERVLPPDEEVAA